MVEKRNFAFRMIFVLAILHLVGWRCCNWARAAIKEMYEISPYATFSVSGGRTTSGMSKTPTRGVTPSTLDYTVQFKTFGHPDGDNLNATAYPALPSAAFCHVKGKSSWQNQRYYNTDGMVTGSILWKFYSFLLFWLFAFYCCFCSNSNFHFVVKLIICSQNNSNEVHSKLFA